MLKLFFFEIFWNIYLRSVVFQCDYWNCFLKTNGICYSKIDCLSSWCVQNINKNIFSQNLQRTFDSSVGRAVDCSVRVYASAQNRAAIHRSLVQIRFEGVNFFLKLFFFNFLKHQTAVSCFSNRFIEIFSFWKRIEFVIPKMYVYIYLQKAKNGHTEIV